MSYRQDITTFLDKAAMDDRVDVVIVPIGKGVLVGSSSGRITKAFF